MQGRADVNGDAPNGSPDYIWIELSSRRNILQSISTERKKLEYAMSNANSVVAIYDTHEEENTPLRSSKRLVPM